MYQLSLIFIFISYFLIFSTSSFLLISLAWFFYGMSSAGMTGSLDTYFVKTIKRKHESIKNFNVKNNYSLLFSGLIGGGVGATIYSYIGINIYLLSLSGFIIAFILIQILIPKKIIKLEDRITLEQMLVGLKSLKHNNKLTLNFNITLTAK